MSSAFSGAGRRMLEVVDDHLLMLLISAAEEDRQHGAERLVVARLPVVAPEVDLHTYINVAPMRGSKLVSWNDLSDDDNNLDDARGSVATMAGSDKKRCRMQNMRKPKRARSGYIIFMGDVRGGLKQQFPDAPVQDITRKIGDLWSKLSLDERRPYEERASAEKLVQDALIAQWTREHPEEVRALQQAKQDKRSRAKTTKNNKRTRTDADSPSSSGRSSFSADTAAD